MKNKFNTVIKALGIKKPWGEPMAIPTYLTVNRCSGKSVEDCSGVYDEPTYLYEARKLRKLHSAMVWFMYNGVIYRHTLVSDNIKQIVQSENQIVVKIFKTRIESNLVVGKVLDVIDVNIIGDDECQYVTLPIVEYLFKNGYSLTTAEQVFSNLFRVKKSIMCYIGDELVDFHSSSTWFLDQSILYPLLNKWYADINQLLCRQLALVDPYTYSEWFEFLNTGFIEKTIHYDGSIIIEELPQWFNVVVRFNNEDTGIDTQLWLLNLVTGVGLEYNGYTYYYIGRFSGNESWFKDLYKKGGVVLKECFSF